MLGTLLSSFLLFGTIYMLHPSMMVISNILYRVPHQTHLINIIYPRTIFHLYLDFTSIQSKSDFWLFDSGISFHMTPLREWFYEYERYNGNVFLGDDSTKKVTRHGRMKLLLNDGRIKTLPGVLHIPGLARNLIFSRKMRDAGVQVV